MAGAVEVDGASASRGSTAVEAQKTQRSAVPPRWSIALRAFERFHGGGSRLCGSPCRSTAGEGGFAGDQVAQRGAGGILTSRLVPVNRMKAIPAIELRVFHGSEGRQAVELGSMSRIEEILLADFDSNPVLGATSRVGIARSRGLAGRGGVRSARNRRIGGPFAIASPGGLRQRNPFGFRSGHHRRARSGIGRWDRCLLGVAPPARTEPPPDLVRQQGLATEQGE